MEPLFSVVIPAYNRANVISRTIDSVLAQTFTDYEIVVIDDGSSDNLKSVIEQYNNNIIHYFYQENGGACVARNMGIEKSRGHFVAFLDSDDTWEKEYLSEVNAKFAENEDFGLVWVRSIRRSLPEGAITFMDGKPFEGSVYSKILKQGYLTSTSFITAKRSLLNEIGGFDKNLPASQDDDICFRLAKSTKIGCVNKVLGTLCIDSNADRISSSASRRAYGWFLLWSKFADDLVLHCGKKDFLKKFMGVYSMFQSINDLSGLKQTEEIIINKIGLSRYKNVHKRLLFKKKIKNVLRKIKKRLPLLSKKQ